MVPLTAGTPTSISLRQRVVRGARRTEGQLSLLLGMVVVLGLAAGLAGALDVRHRAAVLDHASGGGGLPAVAAAHRSPAGAALEVYRLLADADATATGAFLGGGPRSSELRARYRADVARATAALTAVAATVATESSATAVAALSNYLPVYTEQVEDAVLAYHRPELAPDMAYLLGAARLRESAVLARKNLLPAAKQLYEEETRRLAASQDEAGEPPWFALGLGVVLVGWLVAVQIYLKRRTRRLFNVGLVIATVAALGAVVWLGVVSATAAAHTEDSRQDGAAQVEALAQARLAGLLARSDEAMTLIARGNGAEEFDQRFDATTARLDGILANARATVSQPESRAAVDSAADTFQRWMSVHRELRTLDKSGNYALADQLATGADPGGAGSLAGEFDGHLSHAINLAGTRLDETTQAARNVLSGADIGIIVLMALAVAGAVVGMWPRISEYR